MAFIVSVVLVLTSNASYKPHAASNSLFPNKPSPAVSQRAPLAPPGYVTHPVPAGWRPVVAIALRLGFKSQHLQRNSTTKPQNSRLTLLARSLVPWLGGRPYCHDRHITVNEQHPVDQESISLQDSDPAHRLFF
jgi:hypothetical protein